MYNHQSVKEVMSPNPYVDTDPDTLIEGYFPNGG